MDKKYRFIVVGGDLRQIYMARSLKEAGHTVIIHGISKDLCGDLCVSDEFPEILRMDCVILPLPAATGEDFLNTPLSDKKISLDSLFECLPEGVTVFGGMVTPQIRQRAAGRGLDLIDYFDREETAILNAVPTAEGACAIAMGEIPITLHKSAALVIGFGRVGKILAHRLHMLGCNVTVSARSYPDFAWIEAYGYGHTDIAALGKNLEKFDVIFNTVPSLILTAERLGFVRDDCPVIDLASKPGGVDFSSASEQGKNIIWALSLPGKYSPLSSGSIIGKTIFNILDELEETENVR